MPLLSSIARMKKIGFFLKNMPVKSKILEIGSGDGWVSEYFKKKGYSNYTCMDIVPPADIVGDIRDWKKLGFKNQSFDVIIAFEVIEHVDCIKECHDLLVPGGKLMLTSPLPCMDPVLRGLEFVGLNQKRTSPHDNLVYFKNIKLFKHKKIKTIGGLSQWGIFVK